jgi:hypothetical protein
VSLGKHLESVVPRLRHHRENALDELERDRGMEEIAHRVDEDHPRPSPLEGQF